MEMAALFGILFVLLFIGVPIVYAIGLDCIFYILIFDVGSLIQLPTKIFTQNDSYVLLAIPLFMLCGYTMEVSGISKKLIDFLYRLVGRQPGALGTATIIACMIFAALTGSAIATTVAIGSIMYPTMVENGYEPKTAAGMIASAGALGPIIPPSVIMVIYGSTMGVSVGDLFLGGIIPGITMGVVFITMNVIYAIRHKLPRSDVKFNLKDTLFDLWRSLGVLVLPVIILGGIYGGIFTPTEAGTIAAIYALVLATVTRSLNMAKLIDIIKRTVSNAGAIMCIICVSNMFAYILTIENVPQRIAEAVLPYMSSQAAFMVMMFVFLIIVGALMDSGPATMILAPIIAPIGVQLGLDPLYIGIMFCTVLCMGAITPPFGVVLFSMAPLAKISFADVVKGAAPFIVAAFSVLLVFCFTPDIVMFLL